MKRALFYAIRKYGGHLIVAVTTEKAASRGYGTKWHGRYVCDNVPTHGNGSDLRGRFKTQEDAEKCVQRIKEIDAAYDRKQARLNRLTSKLFRDRDAEIRNVCDAW